MKKSSTRARLSLLRNEIKKKMSYDVLIISINCIHIVLYRYLFIMSMHLFS